MTMDKKYEINDREQFVRFEGVLLGHASSENTAKSQGRFRWHEVWVFRTKGGQYVVQKIGRTELPGETDRFSVQVSGLAEGVRECLQTSDDDGVIYMTRVSAEAFREACDQDEALQRTAGVRVVA